jgi:hypothetical protein
VRKFCALFTRSHGTTGQTRIWLRIMPRTMVKYFGKRPLRSQPMGIALLDTLVTIVAKHWMKAPRKTSVRVPGPQNSSRTRP